MTNALVARGRLLAVLGFLLAPGDAPAQILVPAPVGVVTSGTGLVYTRSGKHSSLGLSFGAYNVAPTYYGGPLYGPGGYGYSGINQVTVIYAAPSAPLLLPPPALATAPRVWRLDDLTQLDPSLRSDPIPDRAPKPPAVVEAPLPGGRDAGVFRPLAPDNRDRAARPLPAPEPEPQPQPKPRDLPRPDLELPRPPMPDADPKVESARQIALGRTAFAAGEYGRAAQRFRAATRLTPDDGLPYFLLGQALFAGGRSPESVAAIRAGVQRRADWPTVRFPPRELYGANAADFDDHKRRLRDALEEFRDDPDLLFLLGYQLWFDGKTDDAKALFLRARIRAADPALLDRFLAARPA